MDEQRDYNFGDAKTEGYNKAMDDVVVKLKTLQKGYAKIPADTSHEPTKRQAEFNIGFIGWIIDEIRDKEIDDG